MGDKLILVRITSPGSVFIYLMTGFLTVQLISRFTALIGLPKVIFMQAYSV